MAVEQRARVEDYLNDKLQSQADLDNLDTLIESVKQQRDILNQQLENARQDHNASQHEVVLQNRKINERIKAFEKGQFDIDKRLMVLTQSEVSDDAVRKFDATMRQMQQLEVAENYNDLLCVVESLRKEARGSLATSPKTALKPYLHMRGILANIEGSRPYAEDAAPHFVGHVQQAITELRNGLCEAFTKELEKLLGLLAWPKGNVEMTASLEVEWTIKVENLLELQMPDLNSRLNRDDPAILLPLEIMMKPLAQRFRYHFEGKRPTNRLDKPEYYLNHVFEMLNDYRIFFSRYLQPILLQHFRGTSLALVVEYVDSTSALVTAVFPMLREKLRNTILEVSKQPPLFSHLMHELMNFDTSIRVDWAYRGDHDWIGLAGELLDNGWFNRWLEIEKNFALKRYTDIIESTESGEIDFDSVGPGDTKPTKAAMRLNDLLETITDRYKPLASFKYKLTFVVEIQLSIFDRYHQRLNEALEAFLTLSNPIARKVQGYTREEAAAVRGVQGLERLCRIYGSADYLVRKMSDWSNDILFLELWDELQFRSQKNELIEQTGLQMEKVSNKDADDGALFDEICSHYERLRARTETLICEQMFDAIKDNLRPYNRINPWAANTESDTLVSAELEPVIQTVGQELAFLSRCIAATNLRRISRYLLQHWQSWIWDHIIQRNKFSTGGSQQLRCDVGAIWNTFDASCGRGFGKLVMKRLDEAVGLMELQLDDDIETSLEQVEQRIFASNDEARAVLEDLGFESLTESDARMLVTKRIELES